MVAIACLWKKKRDGEGEGKGEGEREGDRENERKKWCKYHYFSSLLDTTK